MSSGSSRGLSTPAGDAQQRPEGAAISGVTERLTAQHFDPLLDEGWHWHNWDFTAYRPSNPPTDGRSMKAALRQMLDTFPDAEGRLPDELWSGEAMLRRLMVLANCIGARVTRPEGFEAQLWL